MRPAARNPGPVGQGMAGFVYLRPLINAMNMKRILLAFVLAATVSAVSAQESSFLFGFGAEAAFPVGKSFRNNYGTGYGGGVRFQYGPSAVRGGSLTAGYLTFTAKGSGSRVNGQVGVLPIMLGIRERIAGNWYFEPQAGLAWYYYSNTLNGVNTKSTERTLSYALATGVVSKDFDLSVRYQDGPVSSGTSMGNISVRVGYLISTRKGQ